MNFEYRSYRSYLRHIFLSVLLIVVLSPVLAQQSWVKVAKDPEDGWRLFVDGEPMAIHGVVWAFTPIGETTTYDLWGMDDEFIQRMIDTDARLLQDMGANAIRVFSDVPPRWITYLYEQYGIYTVVNPLFARYGISVDGRWHPRTNYADLRVREIVLEEIREMAETYRDVPGVLFYLLGNENNYGLEWESGTIEDLPVGQRLEVRAGYLYSLFEEAITIINDIDPTKPVGIVNGDIQYLNIIKELIPSLDILGVNTYRGDAAYDLFYSSVAKSLDVPLVFTELGADAYNIATGREDQYNQALIIKNQWEELYEQSYGKGKSQNTLGAFVFEWLDEWWKHGQYTELDIHNTRGTWNNSAYRFDVVPGENNMNEEWFGIAAQSTQKRDGINVRVPRAAYYLLRDIWTLDQLASTPEEIEAHFARSVVPYVNRGDIAALQQLNEEESVAEISGEAVFAGTASWNDVDLEELETGGVETSVGQWLKLGLDVRPAETVSAGVTIRLQGDVPDTAFESRLYSHYSPFILKSTALDDPRNPENNPQLANQDFYALPIVNLYDAYLHWETDLFDTDLYYHNGHADWIGEGDFFHFLPESFDFIGMDLAGSKAPYGVEFTGRQALDGLKIYAGPEIFWGAEPQALIKYFSRGENVSWSLIYNEAELFSNNSDPLENAYDRRASGWLGFNFLPWIDVNIGVMTANLSDIDRVYTHVGKEADGSFSALENQELTFADTLAGKIEISSEIFLHTRLFARYVLAGRVAETNPYIPRGGSHIADVGTGNRHEFEAGLTFMYGPLAITPRFLARVPISHPLSAVNRGARRALSAPFAVYANREAYKAEITLTYDDAGETYFFEWNNSDRENGLFAASLSFLYSFYEGATDATTYRTQYGDIASFSAGLPEVEGLWNLTGRAVLNPSTSLRLIGELRAGSQQSWGEDDRIVTYFGAEISARVAQWAFSGGFDIDAWGKEDYYRQFNLTYPLQWNVDVSRAFAIPEFLNSDNRIGIQWKGRSYDERAPDTETNNGLYAWKMELFTYLAFSW